MARNDVPSDLIAPRATRPRARWLRITSVVVQLTLLTSSARLAGADPIPSPNGLPEQPPNGLPEQPWNGLPEQPSNGLPEQPWSSWNGLPEQPSNGLPEQPSSGLDLSPPPSPSPAPDMGTPWTPSPVGSSRPLSESESSSTAPPVPIPWTPPGPPSLPPLVPTSCDPPDSPLTVMPTLSCQGFTSDGRSFAVWGYTNSSDAPTHIPIGASNRFTGGPGASLGQPVTFEPGTHHGVFVTFVPGGGPLEWTLGSGSAHSGALVLCPSPVSTPAGITVTLGSGQVILVEENPRAIFGDTIVPTESVGAPTVELQQEIHPAAGLTPGHFSVSAGGDATYSIPLWTPIGRAGMQPDLSLVYSSAAGNGPLGMGWALGGFSQIARCPKTFASDGEALAVKFDATDRWCLDGDYLIATGATRHTAFGAGMEYRPEHSPFSLVVAVGDDGSRLGPSLFVVHDKGGRIHTYGGSTSSRLEGWRKGFHVADEWGGPGPLPDKVVPWESTEWARYAWLISDTQDRSGNGIRYTYDDPHAQCKDAAWSCTSVERVPSMIEYTTRSGDATSTRSVGFYYASPDFRPDASIKYVSGFAIRSTALLTAIQMFAGSPKSNYEGSGPGGSQTLQRRYRLRYSYDPEDGRHLSNVSHRQLLRSVQECDGHNACKAPTIFDWQLGAEDFDDIDTKIPVPPQADAADPDPLAGLDAEHRQMVIGDFDGDGRDDLVVTRRFPYQPERCPPAVVPVCPFTCPQPASDGSTTMICAYPLNPCDTSRDCCFPYPTNPACFTKTYPTEHASDPKGLEAIGWHLYLSQADGTVKEVKTEAQSIWPRASGLPGAQGIDRKGDGTLELSWPQAWANWSTRTYPDEPPEWTSKGRWSDETLAGCRNWGCVDPAGAGRYVLDLNGDGRPELARAYAPDATGDLQWAFRGLGGTYTTQPWFVWREGKDLRTYVANLDGSGRAGLVFGLRPKKATDQPSWYSLAVMDKSGAISATTTTLPMGQAEALGYAGMDYVFADLNGDGITDALGFCDGTKTSLCEGRKGTILLNTGNGFPLKPVLTTWGVDLPVLGDPQSLRVLNYYQDEYPVFLLTEQTHSDPRMRLGRTALAAIVPTSAAPDVVVADLGVHPTVWRPDGTNFTPVAYPRSKEGRGDQQFVQTLDFNGDGLTDFTQLDPDTGTIHVYQKRGKRADLMTHVRDGFDRHVYIDYGLKVGREGTCSYPQHCVARGLWLVTAYHLDRGDLGLTPSYPLSPSDAGGVDHFTLEYEQPRWDLLGRGFLGFAGRTIRGPGGRTWTTAFDNTAAARIDRPDRGTWYPKASYPTSESFSVAGTLLSKRTTEYEVHFPLGDPKVGQAPFSVVPSVITDQEDLTPAGGGTPVRVRESKTTLTYDAFDNPLVTEQRDRHGVVRQRTEVTSYLNDTASWLLGRPRDVVTSSTEGDATLVTVTRAQHHDYDPGTGLLTTTIREPAATDSTYLRTQHVRNADGLIIATSRNTKLGVKRTISVTYDDEGFPATTTNELGHVSRTMHHPSNGALARAVTPNGVTTRYQYDGFGRPRHSISADGSDTFASYQRGELGPLGITRWSNGGGRSVVEYDRAGRSVRADTLALDGRMIRTETTYDERFPGQPAKVTLPAFVGEPPAGSTRFEYDPLGRSTRTLLPDDKEITQTYELEGTRQRTTIRDALGNQSYRVTDERGHLVESVNRGVVSTDSTAPHDVVTRFTYAPFDLPATTTDHKGNVLRMAYDVLGRRIRLEDPDAGISRTTYSAFGEIEGDEDASGAVTSYSRDRLGRVTLTDSTKDGRTCFRYDSAAHGIGHLSRTVSPDLAETRLTYDELERPVLREQSINGIAFRSRVTYDSVGRPDLLSYPEVAGAPGVILQHEYADATSGEVRRLRDVKSGTAYWTLGERNAAGQVTYDVLGNGVENIRSFDPLRGWMNRITATSAGTVVQDIEYAHDANGNVTVRKEMAATPPFASYGYDALGRLTSTTLSDTAVGVPATTRYAYDDLGTLRRRTAPDASTEEYKVEGPRPHAVTSGAGKTYAYDSAGNQWSVNGGTGVERSIDYTTFGLPRKITQPTGVTSYRYDAGHSRVFKSAADGSTTSYVGSLYELRVGPAGDHTHVFYVAGVAQVISRDLGGGVVDSVVQYLHGDHLGSSTLATDSAGAVVEGSQQRFDAYGRREEWGMPGTPGLPPTTGVRLGFTGHEQDDDTGLINMRGRIYDPKLMRFLTPDPIVAAPGFGQSYNRYAYVLGSPTNLTDPSGLAPNDAGSGFSLGGPLGIGLYGLCALVGLCANPFASGGGGGGGAGRPSTGTAAPKAADASVRLGTSDDWRGSASLFVDLSKGVRIGAAYAWGGLDPAPPLQETTEEKPGYLGTLTKGKVSLMIGFAALGGWAEDDGGPGLIDSADSGGSSEAGAALLSGTDSATGIGLEFGRQHGTDGDKLSGIYFTGISSIVGGSIGGSMYGRTGFKNATWAISQPFWISYGEGMSYISSQVSSTSSKESDLAFAGTLATGFRALGISLASGKLGIPTNDPPITVPNGALGALQGAFMGLLGNGF